MEHVSKFVFKNISDSVSLNSHSSSRECSGNCKFETLFISFSNNGSCDAMRYRNTCDLKLCLDLGKKRKGNVKQFHRLKPPILPVSCKHFNLQWCKENSLAQNRRTFSICLDSKTNTATIIAAENFYSI